MAGKAYSVSDINRKEVKRRPYAPFTTSSLQQEASRKLGFSAKKTMALIEISDPRVFTFFAKQGYDVWVIEASASNLAQP